MICDKYPISSDNMKRHLRVHNMSEKIGMGERSLRIHNTSESSQGTPSKDSKEVGDMSKYIWTRNQETNRTHFPLLQSL